jgi:hypothetical protein
VTATNVKKKIKPDQRRTASWRQPVWASGSSPLQNTSQRERERERERERVYVVEKTLEWQCDV